MEGDYGAKIFTDIEAKFYPCKNTTENNYSCKQPHEIDEALSNNYWAIYTSDTVINAKNYEQPFSPVKKQQQY